MFYRGETFRRAFQHIGGLRALTKAPFMALTASAPPEIEREIFLSLSLTDPIVVKHSLNRPNMYICVDKKSNCLVSFATFMTLWIFRIWVKIVYFHLFHFRDFMELGERLKKCTDPSIFPKTVVFCRQKEMVAKVFQFLQHSAKSKDFVGMYHASLSEQTKNEMYRRFCNPASILCCLVATIAFGLVS